MRLSALLVLCASIQSFGRFYICPSDFPVIVWWTADEPGSIVTFVNPSKVDVVIRFDVSTDDASCERHSETTIVPNGGSVVIGLDPCPSYDTVQMLTFDTDHHVQCRGYIHVEHGRSMFVPKVGTRDIASRCPFELPDLVDLSAADLGAVTINNPDNDDNALLFSVASSNSPCGEKANVPVVVPARGSYTINLGPCEPRTEFVLTFAKPGYATQCQGSLAIRTPRLREDILGLTRLGSVPSPCEASFTARIPRTRSRVPIALPKTTAISEMTPNSPSEVIDPAQEVLDQLRIIADPEFPGWGRIDIRNPENLYNYIVNISRVLLNITITTQNQIKQIAERTRPETVDTSRVPLDVSEERSKMIQDLSDMELIMGIDSALPFLRGPSKELLGQLHALVSKPEHDLTGSRTETPDHSALSETVPDLRGQIDYLKMPRLSEEGLNELSSLEVQRYIETTARGLSSLPPAPRAVRGPAILRTLSPEVAVL